MRKPPEKPFIKNRRASRDSAGDCFDAESDPYKTWPWPGPSVAAMTPSFSLIGLAVADLGKSLAFYRRLGIEIPSAADSEPHVEVTLAGGIRLAWDAIDTVRSFDPGWTAPQGSARIGLAFACDGPEGVDRVYADLVDAGYEGHKAPWNAVWGQRYALVCDPDGNSVDLFAPLSTR
jgi:catechol 2,3-dioxygenase-like lactoylglutathione lyase family enzyme